MKNGSKGALLKKLERDDQCELPPPDELRLEHAALGCAGAAMPGAGGSQFGRGISAQAVVPTTIVPITSSATCPECLTGSFGGSGKGWGWHLPNSLLGSFSAMFSRSCRRH